MKKQEALKILSPEDNTYDALKRAYRKACFKYHPDHGGDIEMMKVINLAYELLNEYDYTQSDIDQSKGIVDISDELWQVWKKVRFFDGLKAEITGTWLWVGGNTKTYKDQLKQLGFRWSRNKVKWYFHADTGKRKYTGKYTMENIREKFGSVNLAPENNFRLA